MLSDGLRLTAIRIVSSTMDGRSRRLVVLIFAGHWSLPSGPYEFAWSLAMCTIAIILPIIVFGTLLRMLLVQLSRDV